jgi:cell division protein FtsZ
MSAPAASGANPVGDVHERIRRMLTEGSVAASPQQTPAPQPAATQSPFRAPAGASQRPAPRPAAEAHRPAINPFRSAQALGKHSLEAAVDMFKALGGNEDRRDMAPPRAPEAAKPAVGAPRGDLFDNQEDADLEIPSFLRKKKIG